MRRFASPLSRILTAVASSESLCTDEGDRRLFRDAAAASERLTRIPELIVVSGEGVDPVLAEVECIVEDMDTVRDTLAVIEDRCRDLARLLRTPEAVPYQSETP